MSKIASTRGNNNFRLNFYASTSSSAPLLFYEDKYAAYDPPYGNDIISRTIDPGHWSTLVGLPGNKFWVEIEAKSDVPSLVTGTYRSTRFELSKPINMTSTTYYAEQMVFCSYSNPGVAYIKFATSGDKRLLLAGSCVSMDIYNSSGYYVGYGWGGSYGAPFYAAANEVYKINFSGYDESARFIVLNSPDTSYYPQWFDTFPVNYTFYGGQTEMMQSAMLYPSVYGLYQMELTNFGTNGAVYIFSMNDPEKEFVCANLSHRGGNYLNAYEEYLLVFYAYKNAPAFSTTLKIVKV